MFTHFFPLGIKSHNQDTPSLICTKGWCSARWSNMLIFPPLAVIYVQFWNRLNMRPRGQPLDSFLEYALCILVADFSFSGDGHCQSGFSLTKVTGSWGKKRREESCSFFNVGNKQTYERHPFSCHAIPWNEDTAATHTHTQSHCRVMHRKTTYTHRHSVCPNSALSPQETWVCLPATLCPRVTCS